MERGGDRRHSPGHGHLPHLSSRCARAPRPSGASERSAAPGGSMKIAIPAEADETEPRVAATPDSVKKMRALGAEVLVESGAGARAGVPDADYEAAGAGIARGAEVVRDADVILKVRRPSAEEAERYKKGALVIGIMDPFGNEPALAALAKAGVTAFAMELLPRITRAQGMDVLSSQANLAGYRAVIDAAYEYGRALPR